jgi:plastocyanin
MRNIFAAALFAIPFAVASCGAYGTPTPVPPDNPSAAPAGAIVIDVVGENGTRSFSPNPATVPVGAVVSWHNVDAVVHRVVLDDGAIDSGNIAPGRFSAAMTLGRPGAYHCTIHPSMVGTIVSGQ